MTPEEQAVIDAATVYVDALPSERCGEVIADLQGAVYALQRARTPVERDLTWGTVPAGFEVLAPDGTWYRVTATGRMGPVQMVTLDGVGTHPRKLTAPVRARGSNPAIEALGFPDVLEDEE